MKKLISLISILAFGPLSTLWGQLDPPNEAGVAFAQYGTIVKDLKASKAFWTTLGGKAIKIDGTDVIKFPGLFVFLKKGTPTGSSFGSVVNHVGLMVRNDREAVEEFKAKGLIAEYVHSVFVDASAGWTYSPDNIKIEINTDKNLTVPARGAHMHLWATNSQRMDVANWYAKNFGGKAIENHANPRVQNIPGLNLYTFDAEIPKGFTPRSVGMINGALPAEDSAFIKNLKNPPAPTKGRSLDHVGFEVENLEAFCQKLEANGVKLDQPYSKTRHKSFASAELTDPWGVSIELTEGSRKF